MGPRCRRRSCPMALTAGRSCPGTGCALWPPTRSCTTSTPIYTACHPWTARRNDRDARSGVVDGIGDDWLSLSTSNAYTNARHSLEEKAYVNPNNGCARHYVQNWLDCSAGYLRLGGPQPHHPGLRDEGSGHAVYWLGVIQLVFHPRTLRPLPAWREMGLVHLLDSRDGVCGHDFLRHTDWALLPGRSGCDGSRSAADPARFCSEAIIGLWARRQRTTLRAMGKNGLGCADWRGLRRIIWPDPCGV